MTTLLAALAAAGLLGGLLMIVASLRADPGPAADAVPLRGSTGHVTRVLRATGLVETLGPAGEVALPRARRRRVLLLLGVAGGLLGWLLTGLLLMLVVVPVAVLGLPWLLGPPRGVASIDRLEGLEEWTRNLAGVLAVGVGLEQAITASLRSTPDTIRPQVTTLVARLTGRWESSAALRAFADDLDDVTGDLVAASLMLSARRRGAGLVAVLEGLAVSVAEDVRSRRSIEADRAKPRSTARAITFITLGVLLLLALNGSYIQPYTSGLGQLLLAVLLTGYGAALCWMRQMTQTQPPPRFLISRPGLSGFDDETLPRIGQVLPLHIPGRHNQLGAAEGGLAPSISGLRTDSPDINGGGTAR